jgi:hypothetical protein
MKTQPRLDLSHAMRHRNFTLLLRHVPSALISA